MKNNKRELIRTAKKEAKKTVRNSLVAELKKVSATFGTISGKLEKVIEKGSGKLAKKIAKKIKIDAIVTNATLAKEDQVSGNTDIKGSKPVAVKGPFRASNKPAPVEGIATPS